MRLNPRRTTPAHSRTLVFDLLGDSEKDVTRIYRDEMRK
jgi:hypothetical protein